jgi:hypothetical protein
LGCIFELKKTVTVFTSIWLVRQQRNVVAGQKLATVSHNGVDFALRANVAGHVEKFDLKVKFVTLCCFFFILLFSANTHLWLQAGESVTEGAVVGDIKVAAAKASAGNKA